MTVPSDEALLSFLTSLKAFPIPHKVLTNEAFARKLLLGSMERIGQDSRLRPDDHNASLYISETMGTDLERKFDVKIVDRVHGVSEKDLLEAMRVTPALGNNSSKKYLISAIFAPILCNSEHCTDYGHYNFFNEDIRK